VFKPIDSAPLFGSTDIEKEAREENIV